MSLLGLQGVLDVSPFLTPFLVIFGHFRWFSDFFLEICKKCTKKVLKRAVFGASAIDSRKNGPPKWVQKGVKLALSHTPVGLPKWFSIANFKKVFCNFRIDFTNVPYIIQLLFFLNSSFFFKIYLINSSISDLWRNLIIWSNLWSQTSDEMTSN